MNARGHIVTIAPRILVASLLLLIGACASGPDEQEAAPATNAPAATSTPEADDCETYDPAGLAVEEEDDVWYLTFEGDRLTGHLRQEDAEAMLSVAEHYNQQCFIGRGNDREIRTNYVVEYWQGEGIAEGDVPEIGCIDYDAEALELEDVGESGFVLTDGETRLQLIDTPADGQKALALAQEHARICLIGTDTDVIHEYWL